ncbi:Aldo/keto reductase [Candidatus Phaeomarinobacter ectocarpi]|uniref:Aldo/keto reductase n=1 Tax=Candidatus Phaeomarinibacter ectocarpi TaxID=1458461 RepID=X5MF27_9HYPH|nr:aldo/keto reductase [Candidatus Phaeomarinobacter ectocarpi]CDO59589.1 Aldo/keto reductase [Candidatus Phaeomarinobacter ectocarpi]
MQTRQLGTLWPVSTLTLGGGGLGQLWGETTRDEAVATVRAAVDAGITLLDMAPAYGRGEAETVVAEAFEGRLPEGVRVTTKCQLGTPPADKIASELERRLVRSLETMKVEQADIFVLHSNICPDDYEYAQHAETQHKWATRFGTYTDYVVPAMESLVERGLIGAWGITGVGLPRTVMDALRHDVKPAVVQAVANLMDSPGDMRQYEEPAEPRNIIRTAKNNDVGVLGIRAVQAGALTSAIDRVLPDDNAQVTDYAKAEPFRALCKEMGEDPAVVAHRYALGMEGVDSVILGVKNRDELKQLVDAEARGPLEEDVRDRIDALRLALQKPRIPLEEFSMEALAAMAGDDGKDTRH